MKVGDRCWDGDRNPNPETWDPRRAPRPKQTHQKLNPKKRFHTAISQAMSREKKTRDPDSGPQHPAVLQVCAALRESHLQAAKAVGTLLRMLALRSFRTWKEATRDGLHYRRTVGKVMSLRARGSKDRYFGRWREAWEDAKQVRDMLRLWMR